MNIVESSDTNIARAASILREGGIVSFPTETVYGLGARADIPQGVARIFEAKRRPFFDPLIVHIFSLDQLYSIVAAVPPRLERLSRRFWPGPLTIVFKKNETVPDIVTAGLETVAVRMPRHPVALGLIEAAGGPIAAPSANRFGSTSPTEASHVWEQLGESVDLILDGGPCVVGVESTIIKIEDDRPVLLRPGGIPLEELREELGDIIVAGESAPVEAPGQLPYHYSPATPVRIVSTITPHHLENREAAFLFFKDPVCPFDRSRSLVLSSTGDLREAAANLFSSLHRLDKLRTDVIIAESVPAHHLGLAIMDRLKKAAKKVNPDYKR